jgi:hypothetical protein
VNPKAEAAVLAVVQSLLVTTTFPAGGTRIPKG